MPTLNSPTVGTKRRLVRAALGRSGARLIFRVKFGIPHPITIAIALSGVFAVVNLLWFVGLQKEL